MTTLLTYLGIIRGSRCVFFFYHFLDKKIAIYVPCTAHSLNLVGRTGIDCCQDAVNFFSTVTCSLPFSVASSQRNILKDCIGNQSILKSLFGIRGEAHTIDAAAMLKSFLKKQNRQTIQQSPRPPKKKSQKGASREEGYNIANKMQEIEFVLIFHFWNEILQDDGVSQVLQNEVVN